MKLCIAAISTRPNMKELFDKEIRFMLDSFYYIEDWEIPYIKNRELFLLDSGAFSFMHQQGVFQGLSKTKNAEQEIDWDDYLTRYIKFINDNDVDYFFELDIDYVVGYEKTKEYTKRLEEETGKKCIPVFHKERGFAEWKRMCEEYDYVALGTMSEYSSDKHIIKHLLKVARQYGTKVHGLGFTPTFNIEDYNFYSVDSTSWTAGSRFGVVFDFRNGQMLKTNAPAGMGIKDYKEVDNHNIMEWVKYQNYLARNDKE